MNTKEIYRLIDNNFNKQDKSIVSNIVWSHLEEKWQVQISSHTDAVGLGFYSDYDESRKVCDIVDNYIFSGAMQEQQHKQVNGTHYKSQIQCWDYIIANNLGYLEGNVIKYVTRHNLKNGRDDLLKAIHYLEKILEVNYGVEE